MSGGKAGTGAGTTASRIVNNSIWYGLEMVIETAVFLVASVAVARYLGPEKLGYFSYINFFVTVVTRTGGAGLATATRKYMSEFLALGRPGTARAVYELAYKYQLLGSVLLAGVGVGFVLLFGDPAYRLVASLLIVSIVPGVMSWVPAQANNAFEDARKNTLSAFGYILSYVAVVGLTLHFHWDLVGIASASLVGRTVEVLLRTGPVNARLRTMPLDALDGEIVARIRKFCVEAVGIQLLQAVVWDRSEMVFLKAYSGLAQIAFYSVSFGLAQNLLLVPRTFGTATGMSLMGEASRDPGRVDSIMRNSCRYLLLVAIPVHLGAAAVTAEAIRVTYGVKYLPAIPVLMVASILSLPRAFTEMPDVLLKVAERQRLLLWVIAATGVVNVAMDWALIPRFGAVGAAWANGLAQTAGVVGMWQAARRSFRFGFPVGSAVRLGLAGIVMAGIAYGMERVVPGLAGLVLAVVTAGPVYVGLVRMLGGLEASDRVRLMGIGERLPGAARGVFARVVGFAVPRAVELAGAAK